MGNRAVITTPEKEIAFYLHWNGGRDTVEALLHYCQQQHYRSPEQDGYGWARMAQVVGNFFGGNLSVGIEPYVNDDYSDPGDNGIYVIQNWQIVDRINPPYCEQDYYDFKEMVRSLNDHMPEKERLTEEELWSDEGRKDVSR